MTAGAELAQHTDVVVLEAETTPDRHSTGRSAAAYIPSYGNDVVRRLNLASRPWYAEADLLSPRPVLYIGGPADSERLAAHARQCAELGIAVERLDPDAARTLVAPLRAEWAQGTLLETGCDDIDVAGALARARRELIHRGGQLRLSARVDRIERGPAGWRVRAGGAELSARVLVDAAGAWADDVARLAGVAPLGLTPLRRTIAAVRVPDDVRPWEWPLIDDIAERFYLKPERGAVLVSPADETPTAPGDARPDDLDVALGLEAAGTALDLELRSVIRAWAGLRTFAPDRTPVAGPDPAEPSFVWLAGQGGYGITTAPALARFVASGIGGDPTGELAALGIDPARLLPGRLRVG